MAQTKCGLQVALTLVLIFLSSGESRRGFGKCPRGEFGKNCLYNCHCHDGEDCDKITGSCGAIGCESGYLGDSCQYVNLAYNMNTSDHSKALVDGSEVSCRPVAVPAIFVDLGQAHWIRRVKILVKGKLQKNEFFLAATNTSEVAPPDMTWSPEALVTWPEDGVAEIAFDSFLRARYVWLGGKNFTACEVLVYGGRNLALRRTTLQSSTLGTQVSGLAVNGVTSSGVGEVGCSSTVPEDQPDSPFPRNESSWWQVNLRSNHVIRQIRVYTRHDSQDRLLWFRLLARSMDDASLTTMYQSPGNRLGEVVDVIPPHLAQVALLRLQLYGKSHVLTLCEVQLLGDCPDMTYGPDCDLQCACLDPSEVCDSFSGSCLSDLADHNETSGEAKEILSATSSEVPEDAPFMSTGAIIVMVVGACSTCIYCSISFYKKEDKKETGDILAIENVCTPTQAEPRSDCAYELLETISSTPHIDLDQEHPAHGATSGRQTVFTKPLGQAASDLQSEHRGTLPDCSEMKCLRAEESEADEHDENDSENEGEHGRHLLAGETAGNDDENLYEALAARDYELSYSVIGEPSRSENNARVNHC